MKKFRYLLIIVAAIVTYVVSYQHSFNKDITLKQAYASEVTDAVEAILNAGYEGEINYYTDLYDVPEEVWLDAGLDPDNIPAIGGGMLDEVCANGSGYGTGYAVDNDWDDLQQRYNNSCITTGDCNDECTWAMANGDDIVWMLNNSWS